MSEIPFNIPSGGEPHAQAQTQAQAQAQAQAQTQAQAQALTQAQAQTAATQAGAAAFPPPPQYVVAQQQGMAYPQQPPVAGMMYPQQPYSTYPQNYSPAPSFTQHQAPAPFPQQHPLYQAAGPSHLTQQQVPSNSQPGPSSAYPWHFRGGDATSQGRSTSTVSWVEVVDECSLCCSQKKDLKMFMPCRHYPYCSSCVRETAANHHERPWCPSCRVVSKIVPINRVMPRDS